MSDAIVVDRVSFAFDDLQVLRDVSFTVPKGSMRFLLGASGSGKSVLLKLILGLLRPDSGTIAINGQRIDHLPEAELLRLRSDIGISFQENALFDSLTVNENVGYRLYEESDTPLDEVAERVNEVLTFVGLAEFGDRIPSELSGGQRRRVGIARAMASNPSLMLFDDPTTGLDPLTAAAVNDEVVKLRDLRQVTTVVATHQMRDAFYIATHVAERTADGVRIRESDNPDATKAGFLLLHEGRIQFEGTSEELVAAKEPYLQEFMYNTLPPW